MNATCRDYSPLIERHAIGALDGAERDFLEEHLASGCGSCRAATADAARELSLVGLAAPDPARGPSDAVLERVHREIGSVAPRRLPLARLAAAAALLAIAAGAAGFLIGRSGGDAPIAADERSRLVLDAEHARVTAEEERRAKEDAFLRLTAAQDDIARYQEDLLFLSDPRVAMIPINPGADGRNLTGRAFVNAATGESLVFASVPAAGEGKEYQLWYVGGDRSGALAAATFSRIQGERGLRVKAPFPISGAVTLGITEEPKGGSAKPSSEFLATGTLK